MVVSTEIEAVNSRDIS